MFIRTVSNLPAIDPVYDESKWSDVPKELSDECYIEISKKSSSSDEYDSMKLKFNELLTKGIYSSISGAYKASTLSSSNVLSDANKYTDTVSSILSDEIANKYKSINISVDELLNITIPGAITIANDYTNKTINATIGELKKLVNDVSSTLTSSVANLTKLFLELKNSLSDYVCVTSTGSYNIKAVMNFNNKCNFNANCLFGDSCYITANNTIDGMITKSQTALNSTATWSE